jgi:hypothetical protein
MYTRYVVMHFGSSYINVEELEQTPTDSTDSVEVYALADGPDVEDETELALLHDLVRPLRLVFVGADTAKRLAEAYGGDWIEDTANVPNDLLRIWELTSRRADST